MKRFTLIAALLLGILGSFANLQPVSAAGVNDFTIQDYQIDLYLDRDQDGRSTLRTDEVITAIFSEADQNHGIERAIPTVYDGHPTHVSINSVTDQNGHTDKYTTYGSGDNTVLRIGDADSYVHGAVTYKLSYTQHDVTKFFQDTDDDELYWDTNGTDWKVPIQTLTTRLHVSKSLMASLTDKHACYQGTAGSNTSCNLAQAGDTFTATATDLTPYQNVTLAVGFKPRTFSVYKESPREVFLGIMILVSVITLPIAFILIIWLVVRYQRRSNRTAEIGSISPEYIPPPDTSVSTAAAISRKPARAFSAQLIDYAVRHYTRIYETRQKSFFHSAKYELEIIRDISDLKKEERELLTDIFSDTGVGSRLDMSDMKKNYAMAAKLQDNPGKLKKSISGEYGLRARDDAQSHWFKKTGFITLGLSVITFSPFLFTAAIISFICGAMLKPLTDKGLALARYLLGLEMYIKVAETDRLQMLQSPEGAVKTNMTLDANNPRQLIKLYERVLPYAILFGQEKEWNKRLGEYYTTANTSPDWYSGNNAVFNAAVFSSAISDFTTAATYSNPSSSSAGGSGGGGSSGGGGGGGGGGGW